MVSEYFKSSGKKRKRIYVGCFERENEADDVKLILIGGSLIGTAAGTLLLGAGEIMGASGILSAFIKAPKSTITDASTQWKIVMVGSVFATTQVILAFSHKSVDDPWLLAESSKFAIVSPLGNIISGFLVGAGTKLGNGCTTGHGICGLARLGKRSLVAVMSFMASGILTATLCGQDCPLFWFLRSSEKVPDKLDSTVGLIISTTIIAIAASAIVHRSLRYLKSSDDDKEDNKTALIKMMVGSVVGIMFTSGLAVSTMTLKSKTFGFLDVGGLWRGSWDPTLMVVMGGGIPFSFLAYQFVKDHQLQFFRRSLPACSHPPLLRRGSNFGIPTNTMVDRQLILGGVLFGVGWGIGGLCPGPAVFLVGAGNMNVIHWWMPGFVVGSASATWVNERVKTLPDVRSKNNGGENTNDDDSAPVGVDIPSIYMR